MEGIGSPSAADVVVYACPERGPSGLLVGPDVLTREPHSRIDASDNSVDLGSSTFLTVFGGPVPRRECSFAGSFDVDAEFDIFAARNAGTCRGCGRCAITLGLNPPCGGA